MTERAAAGTVRLLIVGAALGLLGGNVYRRRRRRANFKRAKQRFGTSEFEWTARDFVDFKWHMWRIELVLVVERFASRGLSWLTLGLYQREDLMCCDTEVWAAIRGTGIVTLGESTQNVIEISKLLPMEEIVAAEDKMMAAAELALATLLGTVNDNARAFLELVPAVGLALAEARANLGQAAGQLGQYLDYLTKSTPS
jgi:hypothetical protein